jgi:hypothetical protein
MQEAVKRIQDIEIPASFNTDTITSSQVKDESFVRQFAEKLPESGSHIYWIEVDRPSELVNKFNAKPNNTDFRYSRDNKNINSKYVYVGSFTTTKLGNRFKQHCGWKDPKTYSLQLSKWIGDDQLIFTVVYIELEDSLVGQQLEDQLHRELKPLFGKPGGNNKITIPQSSF